MDSVTVRELCDDGDEVLRRVERGERIVITRDGGPVPSCGPCRVPASNLPNSFGAAHICRGWT